MAGTKEKGLHTGHRERLRKRIEKYGLASLEEHEQLEYLLYAYIPRKDTNPIAHELLSSFGSLRKVLNAEPDALLSVKGMTANAALFLTSLPDLYTTYLNSEREFEVRNLRDAATRIMAMIGGKEKEHLVMMCLDEAGYLIRVVDFTDTKRRSVRFDRDKIVSVAVACKAKKVVLGHNHPSGNLVPSDEDIVATNRISQALRMVGVELIDHVIVSERDYYSLQQHNCIVDADTIDSSLERVSEDLLRRARLMD